MSTFPNDEARLVAVKKGVFNMTENEEISPKASPVEEEENDDDDEIYYLTEKAPFFDMVLSKSHVSSPWQLKLPATGTSLLPRSVVPVVLRHGGKNWNVQYNGDLARPSFDTKWKKFVIDNKLKHGDACVFEVIDPGSEIPMFKVHILRDEMPPELMALVDSRGKTSDSPIVID